MNGRMVLIGRRPARARISQPLGPVLVLLGMVALLGGLGACAPSAATDGPRLSFQERAHDFGQISARQETTYRFAFTNSGSRSLAITEIRPEPASPGG